jgi:protein-tyrosine phosphatase
MIDFHSHLVPGVDDGAATLDDTRAALAAFRDQGVTTVVTTPHLRGSETEHPERLSGLLATFDAAWDGVAKLAAAEFPELRLARGCEVMLDTPAPDLSDPRVRLAGTRFVLVEFPFMGVPPNIGTTLFEIKMGGWTPVVAHPERYDNLDADLRAPEEWRRMGAHLQVNDGSLLGKYGAAAERTAWALLRRGWVDYLGSDYHARGTLHVAAAFSALARAGGEEQAELLFRVNPERLLEGEAPLPVPPLPDRTPPPFWKRVFGGGR